MALGGKALIIEGCCHCGDIALTLEWHGDAAEIPARACGCSFCIKHGGVWTSNPRAKLVATLRHGASVSQYAFGTRTATFHVCARCGAVPFVTSEIGGKLHAVVNVNTLDIEASRVRKSTADFDGEDVDARLARRARNWIGDVRIVDER
jgi:hypothetical protein